MADGGQGPGRAPVTLLTGFLGAGKTSRLNATLAEGTSQVAVIENELGVLGVDGMLVANRHDDGVVELANGCLCCSAEVDLVGALESLAHRRQERPFDRVIIETTGLADVAPVVALLCDPEDHLAEDFVFDGVVTVVDAAAFRMWARDTPKPAAAAQAHGQEQIASTGRHALGRAAMLATFWRQVALADQLIISKADLVTEDDTMQELIEHVRGVNPFVEVVAECCSTVGPLPPPRGGDAGGGPRHVAAAPPPLPSRSLCGSSAKRRRGDAAHLGNVETIALRPHGGRPLRPEPLKALVKGLLAGGCGWHGSGPAPAPAAEGLGEAWRVKGLVVIEGQGAMVLQGVGDQVVLEPYPRGLVDAPFIVVIGEQLRQEQLEEALAACLADAPAA